MSSRPKREHLRIKAETVLLFIVLFFFFPAEGKTLQEEALISSRLESRLGAMQYLDLELGSFEQCPSVQSWKTF